MVDALCTEERAWGVWQVRVLLSDVKPALLSTIDSAFNSAPPRDNSAPPVISATPYAISGDLRCHRRPVS
eukprot:502122-Rhodomonas_salina.1